MKNKIFFIFSIIIYMAGVESTTSARPCLLLAGLACGFLCAIIACIKENKKN
jgi:hypothetical protein